MSAPPPLPSVCAVLDRARAHIPRAELPRLVMNDPGHAAYVAAYARVLVGGLPALLEGAGDGLPLIGSFEITENLMLARTRAGESVSHRWFSVMGASIALLGASRYRYAPFPVTLAALLVDSFALEAASVAGAPVDLLPLVCRELQRTLPNAHDCALALLGELLTATLTEAETMERCRELHARHHAFQQWYTDDGSEKNPYHAARPEFVWGAVMDRSELPPWVALVEERFPSSPELASETRERLAREGRAWLRSSRRPEARGFG